MVGDATTVKELASWYTPSIVDGFGDRLVMYDNTDNHPLEVLRFHHTISQIAGFEQALIERFRALQRLAHPAFASLHAVRRLDTDGSLTLVSTHTPGKRLSAFFAEPRFGKGAPLPFVMAIISQTIHGLAALQAHGDSIAHGALTADRVVLASGGRIRITEHALGSAINRLAWPSSQLWRDLGIIAPHVDDGAPALDAASDVFQVGVLALSLLLGRSLAAWDARDRLPFLLGQWAAAARSDIRSGAVRSWLARALRVEGRGYRSAAEARDDLPSASPEGASEGIDAIEAPAQSDRRERFLPPPDVSPRVQETAMPDAPSAGIRRDSGATHTATPMLLPEITVLNAIDTLPPEPERPTRRAPVREYVDTDAPDGVFPDVKRTRTIPLWGGAALAGVALVEGAAILLLLLRTPAPSPAPAPSAGTPARSERAEVQPALAVMSSVAAADTNRASDASLSRPQENIVGTVPQRDPIALAIEVAARNQRSGGVRLDAPIDLKVLQGDRVLGSTADGPVVMPAGTYQLELLNPALGVRMRQSVTFKAGQIATIAIPIPNGRLSINAQPWAEVLIDAKPYGDTPLANLDIAVGEHEVVFRHPKLGERRQNVMVRADGPTRLSLNFDR